MANQAPERPFPAVLKVVAVLFLTILFSHSLAFQRSFSGFWTVMPVAFVALILAVVTYFHTRPALASVLAIVSAVIAIPHISTVPEMFPLRQSVQAREFQDSTVSEVLDHLAKSKQDFPVWCFNVSTQQLANQRISLTIANDGRLGGTLDAIMQQIDGDYTWHWFKGCGNAPSPLSAYFYISEDVSVKHGEYAVCIDGFGLINEN